jgi:hypothetical protein
MNSGFQRQWKAQMSNDSQVNHINMAARMVLKIRHCDVKQVGQWQG